MDSAMMEAALSFDTGFVAALKWPHSLLSASRRSWRADALKSL